MSLVVMLKVCPLAPHGPSDGIPCYLLGVCRKHCHMAPLSLNKILGQADLRAPMDQVNHDPCSMHQHIFLLLESNEIELGHLQDEALYHQRQANRQKGSCCFCWTYTSCLILSNLDLTEKHHESFVMVGADQPGFLLALNLCILLFLTNLN